ncbi:MAG: type III-B CRISPR module-associated protein Cmr5 [candidate division WOR-3 bacterium]
MSKRTLEQERAAFCLNEVREFKEKNDKLKHEKFKTGAMRLPALIVNNGLVPTLAFYNSKDERKPIYEIVNKWLKNRNIVKEDALKEIAESDFNTLRLATVEALALAQWLKRIVEVEIE